MSASPAREVQRRVLFRVAAGPRLGYGHLVRCVWLADALGVRPSVSIRGGEAARRVARRLGCGVVSPNADPFGAERLDLLVVDDPGPGHVERWCEAGRQDGLFVVSLHDLGIGAGEADILVDGSITGNTDLVRRPGALIGPRFAILDPSLRTLPSSPGRDRSEGERVLIALGGGPREQTAARLAAVILAKRPKASIRIAGGLTSRRRPGDDPRVVWLPPRRGLAHELADCTVAITGGGVTAYEACALGVPAVAVAVVPAQCSTIRALAAAGALLDGGRIGPATTTRARGRAIERVAREVVTLLDDPSTRRRLGSFGRLLIDGRGARRVAEAVCRRLAWLPLEEAA